MDDILDCLIVGGGPAGLTAAVYLGRFHRRVMVIDANEGRLALIPTSHNVAGYPGGVHGPDLLDTMRVHARRYGVELRGGEVTELAREGEYFRAETSVGPVQARTVVLATGVVNLRPPLPQDAHDEAVARGQLRYCPICDAYEQTGRRIGVLGADRHGVAEALFLRAYTDNIVLLALSALDIDPTTRTEAEMADIVIEPAPVSAFDFGSDDVELTLDDGRKLRVDTLYIALGSHTRNDLGRMLGVDLADDQCFATDGFQRCSVPGVYAAGDAVEGLDQISSAMGTGARAAVTIHNDLREKDGQTLGD
ncbi:NAD(P)/FAD-dependent oxidoreductase [Paracoccus sp. Z118]|uniref:NAD(P)/FAD-dependent oxidoreductase n=1 Tax=Paracoccus sp. Z118 TaxID=2851017 RepID=UPI001C2BB5DC|nr:NAD(P)/FAD-dependent oxidoreductase [Paracoccus sp. Z118]MBV0892523.1 NAD(P)/FAD-dependent oxidoreductase [Paracoccus sp. Z118]